jgi:hypothetical protein
MSGSPTHTKDWKAKLAHEFRSYLIIFVYLALFFSVFAWHRRLILAEREISSSDYWLPLVEAAVLGKVVLILNLFRFGRRLEHHPLIVPVLFKTLIFGIGIALFALGERTVGGLVHGQGWLGGVREIAGMGRDELLSRILVKATALMPFIAFQELSRVLGPNRLAMLFFRDSGSVKNSPAQNTHDS